MKNAFAITATRGAVLALFVGLGGCTIFTDAPRTDDKVDYRTSARKVASLDVPPDLTPLARDGRYAVQTGRVSASELSQSTKPGVSNAATATAPNAAPQTVAITEAGDLKVERVGNQRWLVSQRSPEQLWPLIREFWLDRGFKLTQEDAAAGLIETDWAENRANLPEDLIRSNIGKIFENLYSTGLRDRYRTRLERGASGKGTEIYITHHGLEEVYTNDRNNTGGTTWTTRPIDHALEAEMSNRLMLALGASAEQAKAALPNAVLPELPAKARVLPGEAAATLQLDDAAERAWRRVGLALDRSGFTVEERDRVVGSYAVRYVDPKEAGKEGPGFFARMFGAKDPAALALGRYRILVKADTATRSRISVMTPTGAPDNSANAQRIVTLLVDELKR